MPSASLFRLNTEFPELFVFVTSFLEVSPFYSFQEAVQLVTVSTIHFERRHGGEVKE